MPKPKEHSCEVELALVVQYLNKVAQRREQTAKGKGLPPSERAVAMIHADCLRATATCLASGIHRNTPHSGVSSARTSKATAGTTRTATGSKRAPSRATSKRGRKGA